MAKSDMEDTPDSPGIADGRKSVTDVDEHWLEKNENRIHSGQFMMSCVQDPDEARVSSTDEVADSPPGFDFETAVQEPASSYQFGDHTNPIDGSLTKLFECMTLAYSGKLTSPKWKNFKGVKLRMKEKIRLNNIIWREWHMQFIQGQHPIVCQFEPPIQDKTHSKPEAVVLEGKYWKRKLESVTTEYQKWRLFFKERFSGHHEDDKMMAELASHTELLERVATKDPGRLAQPASLYQLSDALLDDDFSMDFTDTLFTTLNQPFTFPSPREMCQLGNADIIQPGLVQLQPSLDEFMDTLEPLPSLHEMLTSRSAAISDLSSKPGTFQNLMSHSGRGFPDSTTSEPVRPDTVDSESVSPLTLGSSVTSILSPQSSLNTSVGASLPAPDSTTQLPVFQQSQLSGPTLMTPQVPPQQKVAPSVLPQQQQRQDSSFAMEPSPMSQELSAVNMSPNLSSTLIQAQCTTPSLIHQQTMSQPVINQVVNPGLQKQLDINSQPIQSLFTVQSGMTGGLQPTLVSSGEAMQAADIGQLQQLASLLLQQQQQQQQQQQNTLKANILPAHNVIPQQPAMDTNNSQVFSLVVTGLNQVGASPSAPPPLLPKPGPQQILPKPLAPDNMQSVSQHPRSKRLSAPASLTQAINAPTLMPKVSSSPASIAHGTQLQNLLQGMENAADNTQIRQRHASENMSVSPTMAYERMLAQEKVTQGRRHGQRTLQSQGSWDSTTVHTQETRRSSTGSIASQSVVVTRKQGEFLVPQNPQLYSAAGTPRCSKPKNTVRSPPASKKVAVSPIVQQNTFLAQLLTGNVPDALLGKPVESHPINTSTLDTSCLTNSSPTVTFSKAGLTGLSHSSNPGNLRRHRPQSQNPSPAGSTVAQILSETHQARRAVTPPAASPPMFQVPSPGSFETTATSAKGDSEKSGQKDARKLTHTSAEQKRRCNIKCGFDTLHKLVSSANQRPSSKVSKAQTLLKGAEFCRKLKEERAAMQEESDRLRADIESLNNDISFCQSQLPETGAPVTRQRADRVKEMFDEYVRNRTLQNWKFWIFSIIIHPLFETYNSQVSTASMDELCSSVLNWMDQHCSLLALRPAVLNSLRTLSTTTSILTDPLKVPQQAAEAVTRQNSSAT